MNSVSMTCHYYAWIAISTLLSFILTLCTAEIKTSMKLHVEGDGFHRTLVYQINTNNFTTENCYVALYLELPSAVYVNVDELADLRRLKKVRACSKGEIDVELFAERAKSQNVTICSSPSFRNSILTLPIHQRYQFAKEGGGYTNVTLPNPKLLLGCKGRIKEYRVSDVELCSPCIDLTLEWQEIPYILETERYIWRVPVGDLSRLDRVTYITLLLTCLATIFVLKVIWQSNDNDHGKKD